MNVSLTVSWATKRGVCGAKENKWNSVELYLPSRREILLTLFLAARRLYFKDQIALRLVRNLTSRHFYMKRKSN